MEEGSNGPMRGVISDVKGRPGDIGIDNNLGLRTFY